MRFIHTSDVHYGMIPDATLPYGKDRASDIETSFQRVVEEARGYRADCLFISGNLFHHLPLERDLEAVNQLFATIPACHVVLISGTNDRIQKNSAFYSFPWSGNVSWLTAENPSVYFEDIHTELHGAYFNADAPILFPLPAGAEADIAASEEDKGTTEHDSSVSLSPIRILLMSIPRMPTKPELSELQQQGYDYIALGGLHQPQELSEHILFSGSPEPLSREDLGPHGVYEGDIHPITRKLSSLRFHPMAELSYLPLEAEVSPQSTEEMAEQYFRTQIESLGRNNIYLLSIRGKRDPELHFSSVFRRLAQEYRIVSSEDLSTPNYDFVTLYKEHPSDLIGYYIRTMLRDNPAEMSEVEIQALYYGIHALISSGKEMDG